MNKTVLGTIVGTALIGLAKSKRGGKNRYRPRDIESIYKLSKSKKAKVTNLDLGDKGLRELPDDIFDGFAKLEDLDLKGNQLTELPDSIGNLTNLEGLGLKRNQLTELPNSIGNLTKLEDLDLKTNQLTELPDSIGNLTNLQDLILDDNPWQKRIPKEKIIKMIQNGLHQNVIKRIVRMNNSIPHTKSSLRIR